MKKILLISNTVLHYRNRIYSKFYDLFAEQGYEFHVVSNNYQKVDWPEKFVKHELDLSVKEYIKFIRELKPDVCINFLQLKDPRFFPLTIYCRLHKIPVIYWGHGINLSTPNAKMKNALFHLMHSLSSAIILYSEEQLKYVEKKNRKKTFIAKNTLDFTGIDKSKLRTPEEVKSYYGIKEKRIVMYISRILPYKKLDLLLDLFKDTPDIGVVVVGGGINEQQQSIIDLTPNYYYLGEKYGKEVDEIYQMGDVFSTPGHIGLAINQAFYWGKPVVILNSRHAPEITYMKSGVNGYLANSEEELKKIICEMCRDDEKLNEYSKHARQTYEKEMRIENMFEGFINAVNYVTK